MGVWDDVWGGGRGEKGREEVEEEVRTMKKSVTRSRALIGSSWHSISERLARSQIRVLYPRAENVISDYLLDYAMSGSYDPFFVD